MPDHHEREDAHEAETPDEGDARDVGPEVSNDNAPIDELEDAITQRTVRLAAETEAVPEYLD